eukprot:scaffold6976_cov118-Isochrysis_galbana.AAC.5
MSKSSLPSAMGSVPAVAGSGPLAVAAESAMKETLSRRRLRVDCSLRTPSVPPHSTGPPCVCLERCCCGANRGSSSSSAARMDVSRTRLSGRCTATVAALGPPLTHRLRKASVSCSCTSDLPARITPRLPEHEPRLEDPPPPMARTPARSDSSTDTSMPPVAHTHRSLA